jgi:hypothetical protein
LFRWIVFYLVIVLAIVAFVSFVLGVQIPGISPTPFQPSSPFQP